MKDFTAITGTATLTINEPLSVTKAASTLGACTTTPSTVTCTLKAFAGDSGTIDVTIANASDSPISATPTASSGDPTVTLGAPAPVKIDAGGTATLTYNVSVGQSGLPNQSVTLNFTLDR